LEEKKEALKLLLKNCLELLEAGYIPFTYSDDYPTSHWWWHPNRWRKLKTLLNLWREMLNNALMTDWVLPLFLSAAGVAALGFITLLALKSAQTKEDETCKTIEVRVRVFKNLLYPAGGFVLLFGYLAFSSFLEGDNAAGFIYALTTLLLFTFWTGIVAATFREALKLKNCG